jgi:hypothetical protein
MRQVLDPISTLQLHLLADQECPYSTSGVKIHEFFGGALRSWGCPCTVDRLKSGYQVDFEKVNKVRVRSVLPQVWPSAEEKGLPDKSYETVQSPRPYDRDTVKRQDLDGNNRIQPTYHIRNRKLDCFRKFYSQMHP